MKLSKLQIDAISELFNIASGRAAASLSKLVNEKISLQVPHFELVKLSEIGQELDIRAKTKISAVRQGLKGDLEGNILLVFPEEKSNKLVQLILGEDPSQEITPNMEVEALTEVANIVINAFTGAIANSLKISVSCSLPVHFTGSGREIVDLEESDKSDPSVCLFVYVGFETESHEIKGYLLLLLNFSSMEIFVQGVDNYLATVNV